MVGYASENKKNPHPLSKGEGEFYKRIGILFQGRAFISRSSLAVPIHPQLSKELGFSALFSCLLLEYY